jgi:hypothetical protein
MRLGFSILIVLILTSCSNNPETFIPHLNGYWEIESVTLSDGTKRSYKFNGTIDYISISDSLAGFRKKLKPSFDGSFSTSNDAETITLKIENNNLIMYYKTEFSNWKETVLNASESELRIINTNKDVYLYKRYHPLNLE